jgi:hypothetical protein
MKFSPLVAMVAILVLTLLASAQLHAAVVVKTADGTVYSRALFTQYGPIHQGADGTYDVASVLEDRLRLRDMSLPDSLTILIPSSGKLRTQLVSVNLEELRSEVRTVRLEEERRPLDGYALRTFRGPHVFGLGQEGGLASGAMYVEGAAGQVRLQGGLVNGSFYLPTSQESVRLVFVSTGYTMSVVEGALPQYIDSKTPGSFDPVGVTVVLEPQVAAVTKVLLTNMGLQLPEGTAVVEFYHERPTGDIVYTVGLWVGERLYGQQEDLSSLSPNSVLRWNIGSEVELPSGRELSAGELPKTATLVQIDSTGLRFTTAKSPKPTKVVGGVDEEVFDPFLRKVIAAISLFGLLCGILVGWLWLMKFREAKRLREAKESRRALESLFAEIGYAGNGYAVIQAAVTLTTDNGVDKATQILLGDMLKRFQEVRKARSGLIASRDRLKVLIARQKVNVRELLSLTKRAFAQRQYDAALGQRALYEQASRDLEGSQGSLVDIEDRLAVMGKSLIGITDMIANENARARLSQDQTSAEVRVRDLQRRLHTLFEEARAAYEQAPVSERNRPDNVTAEEGARRRSRQEGVSAADVDELREFIEQHA